MSKFPLDRRNFLKTGSIALPGTTVLSQYVSSEGISGLAEIETSKTDKWTTLITEFVVRRNDVEGILDVEMSLNPDDEIDSAEIQYDTDVITVVEPDGLEPDPNNEVIQWNGTPNPSAVIEYDLDEAEDSGGTAITDDWVFAFVTGAFGPFVIWSSEKNIRYLRKVDVDGKGIAGGRWVYLGDYDDQMKEVSNERLRIVKTADADIGAETVLGNLELAATHLDVGGRAIDADRRSVWKSSRGIEVTGYVVTDPVRGGGLTSANDFWIHEGSTSTDIGVTDTLIHEYVHTRQEYYPDETLRWTIEAAADYYPALLSWKAGNTGYAQDDRDGPPPIGPTSFVDLLERGTDHESVVLADPGTWGWRADYEKGALVIAALDAKIQTATDGEESFEAVFKRLNQDATISTEEETTDNRKRREISAPEPVLSHDDQGMADERRLMTTSHRKMELNNSVDLDIEELDEINTKNLSGDDLQRIAEDVADESLDEFFETYIQDDGTPKIPDHKEFPKTMGYYDPEGSIQIESVTQKEDDEKIKLSVTVKNFVIENSDEIIQPNQGHLHVFFDRPAVNPAEKIPDDKTIIHLTEGETTVEIEVPNGTEIIRVQASDAERIAYDLSDSAEITDEDTERDVAFYAEFGEDPNVIETEGLRESFDDWRGGDIDTDLLRDVIDHWRSGEPVE